MKEQNNIKTDEELVTAYIDGDCDAFTELVHRYKKQLHHFFGENSDALDMVQETFKKAFKSLTSFNHVGSFKSWIYRIAKNCSIDENRKIGVRFNLHNTEELIEVIDTKAHSPMVTLSKHERNKIILQAIRSLTEKQRQVLILSYFHGHSYSEIAEKMDCSISSVKTHMSRAVLKLAKTLPEAGGLL